MVFGKILKRIENIKMFLDRYILTQTFVILKEK